MVTISVAQQGTSYNNVFDEIKKNREDINKNLTTLLDNRTKAKQAIDEYNAQIIKLRNENLSGPASVAGKIAQREQLLGSPEARFAEKKRASQFGEQKIKTEEDIRAAIRSTEEYINSTATTQAEIDKALEDIKKYEDEIRNYQQQGYMVISDGGQYKFIKYETAPVPEQPVSQPASQPTASTIPNWKYGPDSDTAIQPTPVITTPSTNMNRGAQQFYALKNRIDAASAFNKLPEFDRLFIEDFNLKSEFMKAYKSGDINAMKAFEENYNNRFSNYYYSLRDKQWNEWKKNPQWGEILWAGIQNPGDALTKWGITDKQLFENYIFPARFGFAETGMRRDLIGFMSPIAGSTYMFMPTVVGKPLGRIAKAYPVASKIVSVPVISAMGTQSIMDTENLIRERNVGGLLSTGIQTSYMFGRGGRAYERGTKSEYKLPFSDYEARMKLPSKTLTAFKKAYEMAKPTPEYKLPRTVTKAVDYAKLGYKRLAGFEKKMGTATLMGRDRPTLTYLETNEPSPLKTTSLKYREGGYYRVGPSKEWVPYTEYEQYMKAYQKGGISKSRYTWKPFEEGGRRFSIGDKIARTGSMTRNLKLQVKPVPKKTFRTLRWEEMKAMSPKIYEKEFYGPQLKTDVKYYKDLGVLTEEGYYGRGRLKIRIPKTRTITMGIRNELLPSDTLLGIGKEPRSFMKIQAYKPRIRPVRLETGERVIPKYVVKRSYSFEAREGAVTSAHGGLQYETLNVPTLDYKTELSPKRVYVPLKERTNLGGVLVSSLRFNQETGATRQIPDYMRSQIKKPKMRYNVNTPIQVNVPFEIQQPVTNYETKTKQERIQKQKQIQRVEERYFQRYQMQQQKPPVTSKPKKIFIPPPSVVVPEKKEKKRKLKYNIRGGYRERKFQIGSLLFEPIKTKVK